MTTTTDADSGLDLERLRHEIRRALDARGEVLLENVPPGSLSVDLEGSDVIRVRVDGTEVGQVLRYRLDAIDQDALDAQLAEAIAAHPEAATIRHGVERGLLTYAQPPGSDFVYGHLEGALIFAIHRSRVVPTWPIDC